jgi:hypothetical protein
LDEWEIPNDWNMRECELIGQAEWSGSTLELDCRINFVAASTCRKEWSYLNISISVFGTVIQFGPLAVG